MRVGVLLLATLMCGAAPAGPARKFTRVKGADFSREQLIRLARQALKGSSGSFVQVNLFGEGGGPPLAKPSHFDYEHWREMYEIAASQKMQVAEAVSIGRNAVLRIHQSDGSISKEILCGRDPLQLTLTGKEFEIVYFGFSGPSRLGLQESVVVFVRAHSPVDSSAGVELFKRLEPLFPGFGVRVEIRSDAWFVYQQRYPFFNPFNEDRNVPSQREYESSPTMICTGAAGVPRCEVVNL